MRKIWILFFAFIFAQFKSIAEEAAKPKPLHYYLNVQYAGNVGLGSIGLGVAPNKGKRYIGLLYGYLPPINDVEVHTFAIKYSRDFLSFKLFNKLRIRSYVGTNLNCAFTKNTYLKYPDYYPENYYKTNALHLAPFIGFKSIYRGKKYKKQLPQLYFEAGTLDNYLYNSLQSKAVEFTDIWNLAVGLSFKL